MPNFEKLLITLRETSPELYKMSLGSMFETLLNEDLSAVLDTEEQQFIRYVEVPEGNGCFLSQVDLKEVILDNIECGDEPAEAIEHFIQYLEPISRQILEEQFDITSVSLLAYHNDRENDDITPGF